MRIDDKNYSVEYVSEENKIIFSGNLRLQSVEKYNEIMDFIYNYAKASEETLILDLTKLTIINSSGIASLGLFLIKMRELEKKIKIIASKYIQWQAISLKDFKEINNNLTIDYVVHH